MESLMIDVEEIRVHTTSWGTSEEQIRKDHLISHLLSALAGLEGFIFFGGTALNRIVLVNRRLSEDIDLYLDPASPADTSLILDGFRAGTRREFPDLLITSVGTRGDVRTFAVTAEDLTVQLQVVGTRQEMSRYETALADVELRYSDLPSAVALRAPVADAFVAMKCIAYEDRRAPRDLYDLASLARAGAIRPTSIEALRKSRNFGPIRERYSPTHAPSLDSWETELAHQLFDPGSPLEALEAVREALGAAAGWDD